MAFEGKERQKDEGIHIENAERLVTEIEMLKVVLRLAHRDMRAQRDIQQARTLETQDS